jgi:signal transduction histidine kinase
MTPPAFPASPDTADAVVEALGRQHLLLLVGPDGIIRDANALADAALAVPGERLAGRSLRRLVVSAEAPARADLWEALAGSRDWRGAVPVNRAGVPVWVELTLSARAEGGHVGLGRVLPGEPGPLAGVPHDELLRSLVAVLVHELRTPLGGLTLGLDVVTRRLAKVGEERGFGDQHRGLLARINEVLDELVTFVRPRAVCLAPLDLHALLTDLARQMPLHEGGTLVVVPPEAPCLVSGDALALSDALGRLLRNACEASPPGSEVRVSMASTTDRCEVRIVDAGSGFAEKARARLFQPFVTTKHRNLGLGLATARHVLQLHGGDLGVRPAARGGTEVWVVLPAAPGGS